MGHHVMRRVGRSVWITLRNMRSRRIKTGSEISDARRTSNRRRQSRKNRATYRVTRSVLARLLKNRLPFNSNNVLSNDDVVLSNNTNTSTYRLTRFLVRFQGVNTSRSLMLLTTTRGARRAKGLFRLVIFKRTIIFRVRTRTYRTVNNVLRVNHSACHHRGLLNSLFVIYRASSSCFGSGHHG